MTAMVFYGKTPVFRDVVRVAQRRVFDHFDTEQQKPVFKTAPTLLFEGSVKLHGANCAITLDLAQNKLHVQSRKHLITPAKDHDGFAQFVTQHENAFRDVMGFYIKHHGWAPENGGQITLYGEWAGAGIKDGVAISALPPTFYIFGLRYTPLGYQNPFPQQDASLWFDSRYPSALGFAGLDHVLHYPTYTLEIDFAHEDALHEAEQQLAYLTEQVVQSCPVAQHHGVSGTGEGIVWVHQSAEQRLLFKTKGFAHQVVQGNSNAISTPQLSSTEAFVQYAVTPNRLKQIRSESPEVKDALGLAEAVWQDVRSEEGCIIKANGLSEQAVRLEVLAKAQQYFADDLSN